MAGSAQTDRTKYLLGILPEEEQARFEDQFFADDQEFEELEIAEVELIDAYVGDALPVAERRLFEKRLLDSPPLHERVQFARILARKTADFKPQTATDQQPPAFQAIPASSGFVERIRSFFQRPTAGFAFAVILVLLAIVAFIGWLRWRAPRNATQIEAQQKEQKRKGAEQAALENQKKQEQETKDKSTQEQRQTEKPPDVPVQRPGPVIASITLTPGLVRSGGGAFRQVSVGPNTRMVQIILILSNTEYSTYSLIIQSNENGKTVFVRNKVKPIIKKSGTTLLVSVPGARLTAGDYMVRLSGITPNSVAEPVDDYSFRVVKN